MQHNRDPQLVYCPRLLRLMPTFCLTIRLSHYLKKSSMADPRFSNDAAGEATFSAQLLALHDKLQILLISHMFSTPARISLLTSTQRTKTLCLPLKHDDQLSAIAEEQVRSNTFFWPLNAPNVTPLAREVRHLGLDLSIAIDGGSVTLPQSSNLTGMQVAKFLAIPYFFPKLESLTINVQNLSSITPGASYVDKIGAQSPAAALPEAMTMERCWKLAEILDRVRELRNARWRKNTLPSGCLRAEDGLATHLCESRSDRYRR